MKILAITTLPCFLLLLTSCSCTNTGTTKRQMSRSDPNIGNKSPVRKSETMPSLTTSPTITSMMKVLDNIINDYLKKFEIKLDKISNEIDSSHKSMTAMQTDLGYILHYLYPPSCSAIGDEVYTKSGGVVTIKPPSVPPVKVSCEKDDVSGDIWTVILRRNSGTEKFNRSYKEYQTGFGNPGHEYWIGNDVLHALTSSRPHVLKVQLEGFDGKKAVAFYDTFSVGSDKVNYQLTVDDYNKLKSTAGDGLKDHNQMKFTTYDLDNDLTKDGNCAQIMGGGGGWWYNLGYHVLGTGQYRKNQGNEWGGIHWYPWKDVTRSLKSFVMTMKPAVVRPKTCPPGQKCP